MHRVLISGLLLVIALLFVSPVFATVLVVAPHPDDEALMFSGIIHGALQRGEDVKVVLMTNGDVPGTSAGYARQLETVAAMGVLGLSEDNIIFLGYPDAGLKPIYDRYTKSSDTYTSVAGQTRTYGKRGLGRADYHTYKFGSAARYNRVNILADLESIIATYRPEHVFVTNPLDRHDDHAYEYTYVHDVLVAMMGKDPAYRAVLHSTIIHGGNDAAWPAKADPAVDFTEPPVIYGSGLVWNDRETIRVLPALRLAQGSQNLKNQAILKYASQVNTYLLSFVHRDEIFWGENIYDGNAPPIAIAGADQVAPPGTRVTLNGRGSHDPNGDTLSYSWTQLQGATVTLANSQTATPSFIAAGSSNPLVFQLMVSDGKISSYPATVAIVTDQPGNLLITTTTTGNGSITCTPGTSVRYNTETSCTVTPGEGSRISEVTVDGAAQKVADPLGFTYSFGAVTADHTITARFSVTSYTVGFVSAGNGTITGAATQSVEHGGSTTAVTAVPATGYLFAGWSAPGGFTSTVNPLVLTNVTASQTVTATFSRQTFRVEFLAGSNGFITGSAIQTVGYGGSTTAVTAVPAAGYRFSRWTDTDGFTSSDNPLTMTGVTDSHVITAAFAQGAFTVTFASGGNGTITGQSTQTVTSGASTTSVTAVPATGYRFVGWSSSGGFTSAANPLVIANVTSAMTVTASFAPVGYTVTPRAGSSGSITPSSPQTVASGGTVAFAVAPAVGFRIAAVSGCGGSLAGGTYTTAPVTADCTVTADFVATTYSVTASVGAGRGNVNCTSPVAPGASSTCTILPGAGYQLGTLTDNGVDVMAQVKGGSYVIGSVAADHAVSATFAPVTYTLTDAVRAQQQALGKGTLPETERTRFDVAPLGPDGQPRPDGVIDVADVVIMLRRLVGVVTW